MNQSFNDQLNSIQILEQLAPLQLAKEHLPGDIIDILERLGKADHIPHNQLYYIVENGADCYYSKVIKTFVALLKWQFADRQLLLVNTAIDDTSKDPMIVMGKPLTTAFVSANVHIPTEKVGCLQVTKQLKEFLNHFPPESKEKAFEQIYEILQVLDAYLIDNPQQHLYCMSPDSEYVSLIMYATKIEIDLCNFPAIWAVLSILLDTQSNTLQYVKSLQQVVNNDYDKHPMDFMSRLEHQASKIMKAMYDGINNNNFDSVSGDTDRVSGAVDNDYDTNDYDKDEHVMPYDKDEHVMPYDKDTEDMPYDSDNENTPDDSDNDQMPTKYAKDYETVLDKAKYHDKQ